MVSEFEGQAVILSDFALNKLSDPLIYKRREL